MSFCFNKGKDKITFLAKEDFEKLPNLDEKTQKALFEDDDEPKGLIASDGNINWSCPCLGNMAVGPCAQEFRSAFTCFHDSNAEPKGSDCLEKFSSMQNCFIKYPELYGDIEEKGDQIGKIDMNEENTIIHKDNTKSENKTNSKLNNESPPKNPEINNTKLTLETTKKSETENPEPLNAANMENIRKFHPKTKEDPVPPHDSIDRFAHKISLFW